LLGYRAEPERNLIVLEQIREALQKGPATIMQLSGTIGAGTSEILAAIKGTEGVFIQDTSIPAQLRWALA
jgi:hypothetical protein